ncbi:MAG TPA: hypothetical protein VNA28_01370 [Solirubrobacteraceae bacterium]|nr:hypothetical protein [Solirubrobacteraceae bacterium]
MSRGAAAIVLLLVVAGLAVRAPPAAVAAVDAGCFKKATTAKAQRVAGKPLPTYVIGDSVMIYSVPLLGSTGFDADAKPCRSFRDAERMIALKARNGTLPAVVVVALGSNGPFTVKDIQRVLRIMGPDRRLALITARKPVNLPSHGAAAIYAAGRIWTTRVRVLDWVRLSAGHEDWFASDGVHLGSADGIRAYTNLLRSGYRRGDD